MSKQLCIFFILFYFVTCILGYLSNFLYRVTRLRGPHIPKRVYLNKAVFPFVLSPFFQQEQERVGAYRELALRI